MGQLRADEAFRRSGLKRTRQRAAVFDALVASERYLSAAEVYETVKGSVAGIGLATVYRTLEMLARLGLVTRVHLPDGCHRYHATTPGHQHELVCSLCGRIVEFPDCTIDDLARDLATRTRFQINGHWLQLFGHCQECSESTSHDEERLSKPLAGSG